MSPAISLGIIAGAREKSTTTVALLYTNVEMDNNNVGGPLLTLDGELAGMLAEKNSTTAGTKSIAVPNISLNFLLAALEPDDDNLANVSSSID